MTGKVSNWFLLCAVGYLMFSSLLGLAMILSWRGGNWSGIEFYLTPSHAHMMLLGWVSMTIYAMMYRIVPAFFGRKLYSGSLAMAHFWLANVGLIGMALFFFLNRWQEGEWVTWLAVSGSLQVIGIYVFGFNMFASVLAGGTNTSRKY